MHVLFIAEKTRCLNFFPHAAVRRDDLTGMRFTDVDKEKFDLVAAKTVIQLVDPGDATGGHGASSRTEDQQTIFLFDKIAETDVFAFERGGLEVRRAFPRARAGKGGLGQ